MRCVALLVSPRGCDVRGIGLEHIGLRIKGKGKSADLQGPFISHRPAKAKRKTQVDKHACLLFAAIECMRNATPNSDTPALLEHCILGAAHMQNHRQIELASNTQLFDKKMRLPFRVRRCNEVIQSDFTDADETGIGHGKCDGLAQHRKVCIRCPIHTERVNAQRVAHHTMPRRQIGDRLKVASLDRRHDDQTDSGIHC